MSRITSNSLFLTLLFCCCATVTASAQGAGGATSSPTGFRGDFFSQLEDAEKKVLALAEATPTDKYSWRPAQGVRSTSEVFMHIAGGNYFLASMIGAKAPEGVNLRELEKTTDKAKVVDTLKQSFNHVRQAAQNMSDTDLEKSVKMFGRDSTMRGVLFTIATHAHEHLGQAIAYARMSGIVPPWSQKQ